MEQEYRCRIKSGWALLVLGLAMLGLVVSVNRSFRGVRGKPVVGSTVGRIEPAALGGMKGDELRKADGRTMTDSLLAQDARMGVVLHAWVEHWDSLRAYPAGRASYDSLMR